MCTIHAVIYSQQTVPSVYNTCTYLLTCILTCRLTDWKAAVLNVRIHIRIKFPVVVTLPMFFKSILESIRSWSIYHMLRQLVPEIEYSVAVEMLSNIEYLLV